MSTFESLRKKKAITHLLGNVLTPISLFILLTFIILSELVVVPAQDIIAKLILDNSIFEKDTYEYFFAELVVGLFLFIAVYTFAMSWINRIQQTLPLKLEDQIFSKTDIVCKNKPVHLLLSLSNPFLKDYDQQQFYSDIKKLPPLESPKFQEAWEKSKIARHNWRQPLLVINAYLQKNISFTTHLVCSLESIEHYKSFRCIVRKRTKKNNLLGSIQPLEAIDFFDLKQCTKVLDTQVNKLEKSYPDHAIVIDITGGTAPLSVAGATVSFAHDRRFQYMTTGKIPAQLHHYSAQYGSSEDS